MSNAEIVSALGVPEQRAAGLAALYDVTRQSVRSMLNNNHFSCVRNAEEDLVHDTYIVVLEQLDRNVLRDAECLRAYISCTAKYICTVRGRRFSYCKTDLFSSFCTPSMKAYQLNPVDPFPRLVVDKASKSPFDLVSDNEELSTLADAVNSLPEPKRSIYVRALEGQGPEEICRDLHLTPTQYRLHKNRAKIKIVDLCRQRLVNRPAMECAA